MKTSYSTLIKYANPRLTIYIRGQVTYSRIASFVEGTELAKLNKEALSKGRIPHQKPFTTISIKNPTFEDNGRLPEEVKQVISERFYDGNDGTVRYSMESKSTFLPIVVYSQYAGELAGHGIADPGQGVYLDGELDTNLDVTLGLELYSKNGMAGLGLKYILVNEPIRYYSGSGIAADLASFGVTYVAPKATEQNKVTPDKEAVDVVDFSAFKPTNPEYATASTIGGVDMTSSYTTAGMRPNRYY